MTREEKLVHDLGFIDDVLRNNRTYSPIYFKDQEFARIFEEIMEERQTLENTKIELEGDLDEIKEECDSISTELENKDTDEGIDTDFINSCLNTIKEKVDSANNNL